MKNVMKRAWEIYRTLQGDHIAKLSVALRMAWKEVKKMVKKTFEGIAKVVITGRENYDEDSMYLTFKAWEKGNIKRIYINDYKRRTVGYIENGEFTLKDNQGLNRTAIDSTISKFTEEYAF